MITSNEVRDLGIVGAGGAGFPTHVKLRSASEFVILNAAECEPLLHKDKELLARHPDQVLEGLRVAMSLTGARKGIIGIKAKHRSILETLSRRLTDNLRLEPLGDFYPAGDEVTLVYLTTGRVLQPGALPIHAGCLVQNVETLFNLAAGVPVTDKWLTVAGAVDCPATLKVPVGTPFRDVLSRFALTAMNPVLRSGGLLMGVLEPDWNSVVTKTTGGLVVLPADHPAAVTFSRYASERQTVRTAKASCDQCTFCTELCPRYLLGHPVRPETAMRNRMFGRESVEFLHPGNAFCCECNLCTLYACPEGLDPKGATVMEKKAAHTGLPRWEGLPAKVHPMFPFRKVPTARLKQRLGVAGFTDEAQFSSLDINPDAVRIPLKQHIGKPARPVVKRGDTVTRGQVIAAADGDVSSAVHASINGRVEDVLANEILIRRA